jgi:hypothetical protein
VFLWKAGKAASAHSGPRLVENNSASSSSANSSHLHMLRLVAAAASKQTKPPNRTMANTAFHKTHGTVLLTQKL